MSRKETDQRDLFDIDETEIEAMLQRLQQDFAARDFSELDPGAATILSMMPGKLREYVAALQQVKKQKEEIKTEKDPRKKEEKKKAAEAKLNKLASETFTIACASTLPTSEALKFHQKCNLGVKGLNEFGDSGLNPLAAAMASGKGRGDIAQLIDAGADVNFKSQQNSNAAHFAVMFNADPEVMKLLIERGVDVNLVNNFGLTPRDMAVMKGRGELAQILKEAGAKLNRAAPPKGTEEEAGKKDKKGAVRDEREEEERARKKQKEGQEKELAEKKKELEESISALAQRQLAESRLALDLAEKQVAKLGLDFSFGAAKVDEIRPAIYTKTVTAEVPPEFELKVEKQPNFLERVAEKIFGKEAAAKFDRMNLDDLLLFAVQCGARAESLFLVDCGANPNRVEVLQAAIVSGNKDVVRIVANGAQPALVRAVSDSLGVSVGEVMMKLVLNDVLKSAERPVEELSAVAVGAAASVVVVPAPNPTIAESAAPAVTAARTPTVEPTAPAPRVPTQVSPELPKAAEKTVSAVPEMEETAVERPSSRPRGPFAFTRAQLQQHSVAMAA